MPDIESLSRLNDLIRENDLFYDSVDLPVSGLGIRIFRPNFVSKNSKFLLESDQAFFSNICYKYLLFLPKRHKTDSCLILGHGFNEATYTKLIPWAYTLCRRLGFPTIIFPLSFHLNRRGKLWQRGVISSYRHRREIPGNSHFSPFNAVISRRISENPERFFRGCCQSYYDLLSLLRKIERGNLKLCQHGKMMSPFSERTRIHFLGYSISGYLHLAMLFIHANDILKNSRCILFLSGCSIYEMDPVSPLVIDRDAFLKARAFYVERYKDEGSTDFLDLFLETKLGFWFRQIFLQQGSSSHFRESIRNLSPRLFLLTDSKDTVFPFEAIQNNLGPVPYYLLNLGRHEFPFNIDSIDGKNYKDLHGKIKESYQPSFCFERSFGEFVQQTSLFLQRY